MIETITSSILGALLVLGVIIVIHELGHFVVAKLFNIKVETFSVGFGPRLFGRKYGDTDYRVSAFPLGGYIKMAGETVTDTVTGDPREFIAKPKWQRFLVASAGPAANLVLSVGLLAGLFMYGSEVPEFLQKSAVVGVVEPDSAAARAGVRSGDVVLSIDGKDKPNWQDIEARVVTSPDREMPLVLQRGNERLDLRVTPVRTGRNEIGDIGIRPFIRVVVRRVNPGSPAEKAGLQAGDEILSAGGVNLEQTGRTIQEVIQSLPSQTFPLTVRRAGHNVDLTVTSVFEGGRKMIGIEVPVPTVLIKLPLGQAVLRSVDTNISNAVLIFEVLGKLLKREASMKSLDGPIGIMRVSGQALNAGLPTLISLMALISLNLGILNLLPIPILDGGVMTLLLVESVMGRDLSLRMKERIVQVSFVFLLMLTLFVIYNDVVKSLPTGSTP